MEPFVFVVSEVLEEFVFTENGAQIIFGDSETDGDFVDVPQFIHGNPIESENGPKVDNQKRGKNLKWIFVNEFSSADALAMLQLESNWVKFRHHHTQDGQKEYF